MGIRVWWKSDLFNYGTMWEGPDYICKMVGGIDGALYDSLISLKIR
jgi:hypothetical protein